MPGLTSEKGLLDAMQGMSSAKSSARASKRRLGTESAMPLEDGSSSIVCTPCVGDVNDGRVCGGPGCGMSDTSVDPVNPQTTRVFGSGHRSPKSGKWLEIQCWYCLRVFTSRYKTTYTTWKAFVEACGTNKQLFDLFKGLGATLIEHCIEMGIGPLEKIRFNWKEAEKKVSLKLYQTERMEIARPQSEMVPILEYIEEHQCQPEQNGHARIIDPEDNSENVLVPIKMRKRVKYSTILDSTLSKSIADNCLDLGEGDLKSLQKSLHDSLALPKATGRLMAPNHGVQQPLPVGNASGSSGSKDFAPPAVPLPSFDSPGGFGFGYVAKQLAPAAPPPLEDDTDAEEEGDADNEAITPAHKGKKMPTKKRGRRNANLSGSAGVKGHVRPVKVVCLQRLRQRLRRQRLQRLQRLIQGVCLSLKVGRLRGALQW